MEDWLGDWAIVAASAVAGLLALAGGWMGHAQQRKSDRDARSADLAVRTAAERMAFELDAVRQVHDKLLDLAMATNRLHYERMRVWANDGRWASLDEIGGRESFSAAELETMRYIDRLLQPELSELSWDVVFACRKVVNATEERVATRAIYEMSAEMSRCARRLGERLRELFAQP